MQISRLVTCASHFLSLAPLSHLRLPRVTCASESLVPTTCHLRLGFFCHRGSDDLKTADTRSTFGAHLYFLSNCRSCAANGKPPRRCETRPTAADMWERMSAHCAVFKKRRAKKSWGGVICTGLPGHTPQNKWSWVPMLLHHMQGLCFSGSGNWTARQAGDKKEPSTTARVLPVLLEKIFRTKDTLWIS